MRTLALFLFTTTALGACKWTEFDDLEAATWVTATEKPNKFSTQWGVAIQRGGLASPTGGKLVVIGDLDPAYSQLAYASDGSDELASGAFRIADKVAVSLETQPLLLADPTTDDVMLIAGSGDNQVVALHGSGTLDAYQLSGLGSADAAAYVLPPPRADTMAQATIPVIASGDEIYPAYLADGMISSGTFSPRCRLTDDLSQPISILGIAGARVGANTTDDLVVWTATGDLLVYDGAFANGSAPSGPCDDAMSVGPLPGSKVATGFEPSSTSQILRVDATHVLLVGRKTVGDTAGLLALYDVSTGTPALVGAFNSASGLRTATLLELPGATGGTDRFIVAGYPNFVIEGTPAGKVEVYPLDLTTGIGTTAMTLHDAQPEDTQQFGRSVAAIPFNGQSVIAVAADNEVFVYFRTALYGETRAGR